jgi:hypothetical protein
MSWQQAVQSVLTKRKALPNVYGIRINGGKSCSSPQLVLMRLSYVIVVSVPPEEQNIHITYITTYPPSGVHAFNATWTTLHTLWERIHVLRKWQQDIPRSTRPRCAVVTNRTTETQPLPHDRNYPQASLVLRGRVQDSHHPAEEYLHS